MVKMFIVNKNNIKETEDKINDFWKEVKCEKYQQLSFLQVHKLGNNLLLSVFYEKPADPDQAYERDFTRHSRLFGISADAGSIQDAEEAVNEYQGEHVHCSRVGYYEMSDGFLLGIIHSEIPDPVKDPDPENEEETDAEDDEESAGNFDD